MTDNDKTLLWQQGSQPDNEVQSLRENAETEESINDVADSEINAAAAPAEPLVSATTGNFVDSDEATMLFPATEENDNSSPDTDSTVLVSDNDKTYLVEQEEQVFAESLPYFSIGNRIKNRFEIEECLGEGGMGMVFKAVDLRKLEARSRNPHVAIKVLNPALAKNEVLVAALQRECEKAQSLSHPNIITVYDFDRDGDNVFMSMEYLAGQPLTQLIREAALAGGMKLDLAWPIIRKMGEALAYAHKKQIVHSDFKPANVFVTDSGEVKVLDFGIASKVDHADEHELTVFDARLEGGHTPPYASFEMMNGGKADQRDDIYAFGLVVYEMLTGHHPYQRKPASKVFFEQQREGRSPALAPIRGLNRKQWRLLKSAIELLQAQRPKNLDDWLLEFEPKSDKTYLKIGAAALSILGAGSYIAYDQFSHHIEPSVDTKPAVAPIADTVKPPLANAGANQQAKQGVAVKLDGSASRSADGGAIEFDWRLLSKPEGSLSQFDESGSISPQFTPDRPGTYIAQLIVTDVGKRHSLPSTVMIEVPQPAVVATELLQQASSADGVLYLAAGKSQYRIGEDLTLTIRLAKSGYLRVAYVGANSEVSDLLPNQFQSGKVKADVEYRIPPKANSFKLEVTGPVGVDKIIAVFSESPLPKVSAMVNSDGSLVSEMLKPEISTVLIGYDVLKKAG